MLNYKKVIYGADGTFGPIKNGTDSQVVGDDHPRLVAGKSTHS